MAGLESAVTQFGGAPSQRKVRVSVLPTLGTRWLVPRLAGFQSLNPGIEVELRQFRFDEDFTRDDVDLWIALKLPGKKWPRGIQGRYLLGREITPACTPALARNLKQPADLATRPLLHHINYPGNWAVWMEGAGVKKTLPPLGPGFDLGNNLIVAATAGMNSFRPVHKRKAGAPGNPHSPEGRRIRTWRLRSRPPVPWPSPGGVPPPAAFCRPGP